VRQADGAAALGPGALVDGLQHRHEHGDPDHGEAHERRIDVACGPPEHDHGGPCNDRGPDGAAEPREETRNPFDGAGDAVGDPARDVVVDRDDLPAVDERLCEQDEDDRCESCQRRLDDEGRPTSYRSTLRDSA
jgi:hypothetical protein